METLEPRQLLAADVPIQDPIGAIQSSSPNWFEKLDVDSRLSPGQLEATGPDSQAIGPHQWWNSEWIVQLSEGTVDSLDSVASVGETFDSKIVDFEVVEGLGSPGMILMRARAASVEDVEHVLLRNEDVAMFSRNRLIQGQETTPDDTDFVRGAMGSLTSIDLPSAWDETIGDLSTVVGVLDTGIDLAHRDLYLNIWFNQGEIPSRFLDDEGDALVDIDGDGLITFYDLNNVTRSATAPFSLSFGGTESGPNSQFVTDLNGNGYIDGLDILADPRWADGRDSDGNGEVDDFFGVNFRGEGVRNNPTDQQGHGTHVAGTIGAIGGNGFGVTGVNWQTSLMSLRILDDNNQGDTGSAIRAVNYARMMRERFQTGDSGRVTGGANVRVLNNSWGQPGGFQQALEATIDLSGEAGILFVAASGNGNFLGQGVDNDRTPFFPASYSSPGVVAVAASTFDDSLASFSNFGAVSVDIAAPGTGIRSTEQGGGFGTRNGTSMAAPHVAGVAALIWSSLPEATLEEVTEAILSTSNQVADLSGRVAVGGRINANNALNADVFAPSARLTAKQDIDQPGGTMVEFTLEYFHRSGIDISTIGDDDVVVRPQWGSTDVIAVVQKPGSVVDQGSSVLVTYVMQAPGGSWDILDFGDYQIETVAGSVASDDGQLIQQRDVGGFNVRIEDPAVLYVDVQRDETGAGSLRDAIVAANAAGGHRTIILDTGTYSIGIAHQPDADSTFPDPGPSSQCELSPNVTGWSDESSGDFDVTGSITVIGNQNDLTVIDAQTFDRVFKVHPGGQLHLERVTVTGGVSPTDQGGGGILSAGSLTLRGVNLQGNRALGATAVDFVGGGGIAAWDGTVDIGQSWINDNDANFGAGLFACGTAGGSIDQSTLSDNRGGGFQSHSSSDWDVTNSTFSANVGGRGAILNNKTSTATINSASFSADGRLMVFESRSDTLVPGDTNGMNDIFVLDRLTGAIERVSVASDGTQANRFSFEPSISADGRHVAFRSHADNLVPNDNNAGRDIFVFDRLTRTTELVSVATDGSQATSGARNQAPTISGDGRFVTYLSDATNLVPDDTNNTIDIFLRDRQEETTRRVSVADDGTEANSFSFSPAISDDGRFVAFESQADNLVPGDENGSTDIFVFDVEAGNIQRVNVAGDGSEADGTSSAASISSDGRFVTFSSSASNLVPGDNNGFSDVFVVDRNDNSISIVSLADDESLGDGFSSLSRSSSISADGNLVVFTSDASNLIPGETNASADVYVRNRALGSTRRFDDAFGNSEPAISADGSVIAVTASLFAGRTGVVVQNTQTLEQRQEPSFAPTILRGSQLTIVETDETGNAVSGRVHLRDSILVNPILNAGPLVTTDNIVDNVTAGSSELGPLTRRGFSPPVHRLLRGNPAIDSGSPDFVGGVDQLGNLRLVPDVGAAEAVDASLAGQVYADLNGNQILDANEPPINTTVTLDQDNTRLRVETSVTGDFAFHELLPGDVFVTADLPDGFRTFEPQIQIVPPAPALAGDSSTPILSSGGRFVAFESTANNLVENDTSNFSDLFLLDRNSNSVKRLNVAADGSEANNFSTLSSMTPDGRFVAFHSVANNLVAGDTNDATDIFVYDSESDLLERVNLLPDGTEANSFSLNPSLSADGRYVAFESKASNLVPGDTNNAVDLFVIDRDTGTIQRVMGQNGEESNGSDFDQISPVISEDGNFVVFTSDATNLVPGDTNLIADVFVFDRINETVERVNVAADGTQADGFSFEVDISADGRFVAFDSAATGLVPGDNNATSDVFIFDRDTQTLERISVADDGTEGAGFSSGVDLSSDGRFATFESDANNLVPGDTNDRSEIFIYDREADRISRVSLRADGGQSNDHNTQPSISPDGRVVAFTSNANNLVDGDNNDFADVFLVPNPFADPVVPVGLLAGDEFANQNIGLIPDDGSISGRLFNDTAILNGVYDVGEIVLPGRTLFIDANENGVFDSSEPSAVTDENGVYQFADLPAHREHVLRTISPSGFEQVVPPSDDGSVRLFLPAGGSLGELDFGFRPIRTTGQSSDSAIRGRVLSDSNGNGVADESDTPVAGQIVYLDGGALGVRDFDDPQTVTDALGNYFFEGLPSTLSPVRLLLDEQVVQVAPLGNDLLGNDGEAAQFPLGDKQKLEGNPQRVVAGDFNVDGFNDVAVLLAETNKLSIRLNDGEGGFRDDKFDFTLSEIATDLSSGNRFSSPVGMVAAQLDNDPRIDFAVVGNFTGNVLVLLNFDPADNSFQSTALHAIGQEPQDIVAGQFSGDGALDLVVLNKGNAGQSDDETVQVLTNDGSGAFTVGLPQATGGKEPVAVASGDFDGDFFLDLIVAHAAPLTTDTTFGGVTVLRGDGAGGLAFDGNYNEVQAAPLDVAVGDFNDDGRPDAAVANFATNSISILLTQADGTRRVQAESLGTATGAVDIEIADIDNDGDDDVITTKLNQRQVSIFRNIGPDPVTGEVRFEPQENVGLGQFQFGERMPFVIADFDGDASNPGGAETLDIVAVPQNTDTLYLLTNQLVQGSRRVSVSGASDDDASGIDFLVRPSILNPSFDFDSTPAPVVEDAPEQSVLIKGIRMGREGGPALRFSATSSNTSVVDSPKVTVEQGALSATVRYQPIADANGLTTITVQALDAGADGAFETSDDGVFESAFEVSVLPVNDPPTFAFSQGIVTLSQDDGPQTIDDFIIGISPGGGADETSQTLLDFVVTADNATLFSAGPSIDRNGRLTFTPAASVSGSALVRVELTDDDSASPATRSSAFGITVESFDPDSIVLNGSGNTFFLDRPDSQLDGVRLIDIRGTGENTLVLNATRIAEVFSDGEVLVLSDSDDDVVFDAGWIFDAAIVSDGQLVRQFRNGDAQLNLVGPDDFGNPIDLFDVNANGDVSSLDALQVINELGRRSFSDGDSNPIGRIRDVSQIDPSDFRFYDVSVDGRITALDALRVINELGRRSNSAAAEFVAQGESNRRPVPQRMVYRDVERQTDIRSARDLKHDQVPDQRSDVSSPPPSHAQAVRDWDADVIDSVLENWFPTDSELM